MVRKRLVTVLTVNDGVLFRTRSFIPDYRYTLNFVDAWSVDEIVLLDITRPGTGDRQNFYAVVEFFAANCFVPLTVGGGIRTLDDIYDLLKIGADKVAVNSHAFRSPEFISEASKRFGSQCVVVSIDARQNSDGSYEVFIDQGEQPTGMAPEVWSRKAEAHGAGEILIQSIDKDGSLEGYDNRLNAMVSQAAGVPVLVCGGAGKWMDFVEGFQKGGASAVCTTNIYHFTETSIKSAKQFLSNAGISVRL